MTTNVIRFLVHKPQRKIAFSRTTIRIYSDNDLLNAAPTKQIASSASSNIGNFPPLFYRLPSLCCIHWDWRLAVAVWCWHLHIALTATTSIYFFFTSFLHLVTCSLTRLTCCISLPTYLWVRERRGIFEEHVTFTNQLNNIFFCSIRWSSQKVHWISFSASSLGKTDPEIRVICTSCGCQTKTLQIIIETIVAINRVMGMQSISALKP